MDFPIFNYTTAPESKSVIVVGGGPSAKTNVKKILVYAQKNKSIIFASNYNFFGHLKIKSDFTYITDIEKFRENFLKIDSDLILSYELCQIISDNEASKLTRYFKSIKKNLYLIGSESAAHVYECKKFLSIDKEGNLPYWGLGISGLGTILSSVMCRPQKMLIVGIDDPKPNKISKIMFDGKKVPYDKPEKVKKIIRYFSCSLMPTLLSKGICVESFNDVGFFGLCKDRNKIKILE